jgi:hypothetical protein
MSIPDRLWRVVKGQWALANERIAEAEAQADAYRELADTLRKSPPPAETSPTAATAAAPAGLRGAGSGDPTEACYLLLGVPQGSPLPAVEAAYQQRMNELRPEQHLQGSPERALQEGKREAIHAAYEKLRDTLNPTETRFERLEF